MARRLQRIGACRAARRPGRRSSIERPLARQSSGRQDPFDAVPNTETVQCGIEPPRPDLRLVRLLRGAAGEIELQVAASASVPPALPFAEFSYGIVGRRTAWRPVPPVRLPAGGACRPWAADYFIIVPYCRARVNLS